jgi:hypothetical protein
MVKLLLIVFCLALVAKQNQASPIEEMADLMQGDAETFMVEDMMLTKEQEIQMKDPHFGQTNTARRWPTLLNGLVNVPYVFNASAGYSKFSKLIKIFG